MQYRCAECSRLIKGPGPFEKPQKHYYCDECRQRLVEQLIVRDAACRREVEEIRTELAEVTRDHVRLEEERSTKNVLVLEGIGEMAEAVSQPIKVVEISDDDVLTRAFSWIFSFDYKGTHYFAYGSKNRDEDVEIAKEWEETHGTFY